MSRAGRSFFLFFALVASGSAGCASGGREPTDTGPRRDTGETDAGTTMDEDAGGPKPDAGADSGGLPVCVDADGDGFGENCSGGPDCDDTSASVSPAGTEVCNGQDDDCDSMTDEGLDTPVFCGTGACRTSVPQCASGAMTTCTPLPAGTEACNGTDDDCDGNTDEGFGGMTCGIGECARTVAACSGGTPPACMPGSPGNEICNGLDDDCNTAVDDGLGNISCGRGVCLRSVPACSAGVPGVCTPGAPATESCNGIDDNCDGVIDDGFGAITCGTGICANTVPSCVSGMPMSCTPLTPRAETCNALDDDCNGTVDDVMPAMLSCGVGACLRTVPACASGAPATCTPGTPGTEMCGNSIDDNCDGSIDEGCMTCTPPTNTTCASAATYTLGSTVMGNNTCAGPDLAGTCGGAGNDSTYRFTADGSPTHYSFTMTGPTGYDTVLHLHGSSSCSADEWGCVDDSGSNNVSTVTVDSLPQGTYYLVADSYFASSASSFTLTSSTSALVNDTCASAIELRANGVYTGTTSGRANDTNTGTYCAFGGSSSAPDVVYTIRARANGTITASLCGSSFDTLMFVGTTCNGREQGCSDDSSTCSGTQSQLSWTATMNTLYYITIDGYSTSSGPYTLTISGY